MAESNSLEDLSNSERNRMRGGLGILLALAGTLALFLYLCLFMAPTYESVFQDLGTRLPVAVLAAFAIAHTVQSPLGLTASGVVAIAGIFLFILNREKNRAAYPLLLVVLAAQVSLAAYLLFILNYCLFWIIPTVAEKAGKG
jgi:hypothetical protein